MPGAQPGRGTSEDIGYFERAVRIRGRGKMNRRQGKTWRGAGPAWAPDNGKGIKSFFQRDELGCRVRPGMRRAESGWRGNARRIFHDGTVRFAHPVSRPRERPAPHRAAQSGPVGCRRRSGAE